MVMPIFCKAFTKRIRASSASVSGWTGSRKSPTKAKAKVPASPPTQAKDAEKNAFEAKVQPST